MTPVESDDDDVLARSGDHASARLLLALTALYVQRSNHTMQEQQQYTELALGLIDKAGASVRAAVAGRLQCHPDAPAAVIERLGGPPPEGEGTGQVSGHDHGGADAASDRRDPNHRPTADSDVECTVATVARAVADGETAGQEPDGQEPVTPEFGEAFFAAAPAERRRMLTAIAGAGAVKIAAEDPRRFHVRIDIAPWRSRTGAFLGDLERLIDAPKGLCARILNDLSGEPMVVAARAAGMPAAVLQRILVLVSPAAHHSVQRVHELTELYHTLDVGAARELLAAWRGAAMNAPGPDTGRPGGESAAPAALSNLRARFRALNTRIESKAVTSRSSPGNAGRPDLPSR